VRGIPISKGNPSVRGIPVIRGIPVSRETNPPGESRENASNSSLMSAEVSVGVKYIRV